MPVEIVDPILCRRLTGGEIYDLLSENDIPPVLPLRYRGYYYVRSLVPIGIRHFLQARTRPRKVAENWFVSDRLVRIYASVFAAAERRSLGLWPDDAKSCLVLTHDVESADGFNYMMNVAAIEERYGFRSSWNIVPYKYPIDEGLLRELRERGFEIGIHGYNHDGKLYFSRRTFMKRAEYINRALLKYGAVGFRSPATHRNLEWLQDLEIEYDASCFDVDPFQPMPGGTHSIWPFLAGRFVELPYTIPQDHVMFIILRQETNDVWKRKAEWLIENHGMLCTLTHPDYLIQKRLLHLYEDFLGWLSERRNVWSALPSEVAGWWRERKKVANGAILGSTISATELSNADHDGTL